MPHIDIERLFHDLLFEILSFTLSVIILCSLFDEDVITPLTSILKVKYYLTLALKYNLRRKS